MESRVGAPARPFWERIIYLSWGDFGNAFFLLGGTGAAVVFRGGIWDFSEHPSFKISPHVYHLINIHVSFHRLYLLSRQEG
jgi:hypothetical protein